MKCLLFFVVAILCRVWAEEDIVVLDFNKTQYEHSFYALLW